MFWIVVVVLLLLHFALHDLYLFYVRGVPRGPISMPLLGNVHMLSRRTPHLSLGKLFRHYGDVFSFRLAIVGRIIICQDVKVLDKVRCAHCACEMNYWNLQLSYTLTLHKPTQGLCEKNAFEAVYLLKKK